MSVLAVHNMLLFIHSSASSGVDVWSLAVLSVHQSALHCYGVWWKMVDERS